MFNFVANVALKFTLIFWNTSTAIFTYNRDRVYHVVLSNSLTQTQKTIIITGTNITLIQLPLIAKAVGPVCAQLVTAGYKLQSYIMCNIGTQKFKEINNYFIYEIDFNFWCVVDYLFSC